MIAENIPTNNRATHHVVADLRKVILLSVQNEEWNKVELLANTIVLIERLEAEIHQLQSGPKNA